MAVRFWLTTPQRHLLSGVDLIALGPRRLRDIAKPVEVSQVRAPGLRQRVSALADARCDAGKPPTSHDEPGWAGVRDRRGAGRAEGSSVGDVDRGGRGRQDSAGIGGRGGDWPTSSPTVSGFSNSRRSPIRLRCPTRSPPCWASPNSPARSMSESRGCRVGGQGAVVGVRQLRARARRRRRSDRSHPRGTRRPCGFVATSREGLGVADEQLWLVTSLDVGAGIDSAAVSLFVERARSVASRFSIGNPQEAAAVVEICRRLDGIPLAIELAASRMAVDDGRLRYGSSRSPVPAAGRVAARPGASPNTAPRGARGPTTCSTTPKRLCWQRCSVFAGGFDLQAPAR